MSEPALSIERIATGYGNTKILHELDLHVEPGTCIGLIGPNGHGKTTLLRTISGLHPAWAGKVRVRGKDVSRLPARDRVMLGLVQAPQGDALFGDLTVEEHLTVALRRLRRRERKQRVRDAYELFPRLEHCRKQRARTLSGGETRMLSIARTVLLDGQVILIDEPSLGLSPRIVDEVYRQIAHLCDRGLSVLLVEENPVRLRGLAQTAYLLDRGSIVTSEAPEVLLRDGSLLGTYLGVTHELAGDMAEV